MCTGGEKGERGKGKTDSLTPPRCLSFQLEWAGMTDTTLSASRNHDLNWRVTELTSSRRNGEEGRGVQRTEAGGVNATMRSPRRYSR